MSDSDAKNEVGCPVCKEHTKAQAVEAQSLVLTGVTALLNHDDATLRYVQEAMGKFDAHCAMSLYAYLLVDFCQAMDQDVFAVLKTYRTALNEATAKLAQ